MLLHFLNRWKGKHVGLPRVALGAAMLAYGNSEMWARRKALPNHPWVNGIRNHYKATEGVYN